MNALIQECVVDLKRPLTSFVCMSFLYELDRNRNDFILCSIVKCWFFMPARISITLLISSIGIIPRIETADWNDANYLEDWCIIFV